MERSVGTSAVDGYGGSAQDVVANTIASSWAAEPAYCWTVELVCMVNSAALGLSQRSLQAYLAGLFFLSKNSTQKLKVFL